MSEKLKEEIEKSVHLFREGKILLYPTDTVWGIGCDATNAKAINRIFKLKNRNEQKSMIVLLDSKEKLKDYVETIPPIAYDLIDNAASPITIVYNRAKNLPSNLVAADGSIAIRVVKGDYCVEVIRRLGKPLVSTSANISGEFTPTTFAQIPEIIKQKVDYVVDIYHGRVRSVRPSTVLKLEDNGTFKILRM
jgi:L-threonylcarbamoyladenylate synthase